MTLLVGDASTTYATAFSTPAGDAAAYQFTAGTTGTIDTLEVRSSGTANTGVTSVILGVYTDSGANLPLALLGSGTVAGLPAINSWITATGLNVAVTAGTIYWLAVLPIGNAFHQNSAVSTGGTNVRWDLSGGLTALRATWADSGGGAEGPSGFQGLSTTAAATAFLPTAARYRMRTVPRVMGCRAVVVPQQDAPVRGRTASARRVASAPRGKRTVALSDQTPPKRQGARDPALGLVRSSRRPVPPPVQSVSVRTPPRRSQIALRRGRAPRRTPVQDTPLRVLRSARDKLAVLRRGQRSTVPPVQGIPVAPLAVFPNRAPKLWRGFVVRGRRFNLPWPLSIVLPPRVLLPTTVALDAHTTGQALNAHLGNIGLNAHASTVTLGVHQTSAAPNAHMTSVTVDPHLRNISIDPHTTDVVLND